MIIKSLAAACLLLSLLLLLSSNNAGSVRTTVEWYGNESNGAEREQENTLIYGLHHHHAAGARRLNGHTIANFPCYRNLDGSFNFMDDAVSQAAAIPYLNIQKIGIGDSYVKSINPQSGYDIFALKITGDEAIQMGNTPEKGVLFIMTGLHGREFVPPELVMRWVETLIDGYENDADIRAALNHVELHIVLQTNPDGRYDAETVQEIKWRKNVNPTDGPNCAVTSYGEGPGTDLNRNFDFMWAYDDKGSSNLPCSTTFRGSAAGSEPETQAIMNYVESIFPESQRKDNPENELNVAFGENTRGMFLDIHSWIREVIIWSWCWIREIESPDDISLETIGRKFSFFNGYDLAGPLHPDEIYVVNGDTGDYAYGVLGTAAFTFEVGTAFHQDCNYFESNIVPDNIPALNYALKISNFPFSTAKGPDVTMVTAAASVQFDGFLDVNVKVADNAFATFSTTEQDITDIWLYIDEHPKDIIHMEGMDITPTKHDMTIVGSGISVEGTYLIDIQGEGLGLGEHIFYIEARDSAGYVGAVTAVSFSVLPPPTGPVDIFLLIDSTASFLDDIDGVKNEVPGIIDEIILLNQDTQFGLGIFRDYHVQGKPWGSPGDVPYERLSKVTDDVDMIKTLISNLAPSGGADLPESQLKALFEVAAGDDNNKADFRQDAALFIMLWTDASFHSPKDTVDYPGPSWDETLNALGDITFRRRGRRLEAGKSVSVLSIYKPGEEPEEIVVADLQDLSRGTGAVAPAGGVQCGNGDEIAPGEPIVCTGVTGESYAQAIYSLFRFVQETLTPLDVRCKSIVEVVAETGCSATVTPEDVDGGSTGYDISLALNQSVFVGLGDHMVELTATDGNEESDSCITTVRVLDTFISPDEINCGVPEDDWHIVPCGTPFQYTASVSKANGCPANIVSVSSASCERCNGAGKVIDLRCKGVESSGNSMIINNSNGVGNFIRWTVTAQTNSELNRVTVHCGVCVEVPTNDECGRGPGKGKGKGKGKGQLKGKGKGKGNVFQCPDTYPSVDAGENQFVSWPEFSLSEINQCPD